MRTKNIDLYCFTGTGNTLAASRALAKALEGRGFSVEIRMMERSDPAAVRLDRALGLAFPVAVFSTFPLVWDFFGRLPKAGGTEVFMLDTLGGSSGAIVGPLRRLLERKGYVPVGAKEIIMPNNVFSVRGDERNAKDLAAGLDEARAYAAALADGAATWPRGSLFSQTGAAFSRAVMASWAFRWSQRLFAFPVDRAKCTSCGICAALCPTKNITMDGIPRYGAKCQYCLRCASFCPAHALRVKFNSGGRTWRAMDIKELQ